MSPDRAVEQDLARVWGRIAGMDEVGRGALAGPVCVGVVVVEEEMPPPPEGLTDSKLLTPSKRKTLVEPVQEWASSWAVGMSSAEEIDRWGLTEALRVAGMRALEHVGSVGCVLLDGKHNWLGTRDLFDHNTCEVPVVTQVKGDLLCTAVAAASIVAKVARDALMEQLPDPGYDWARNKGYGSWAHRQALVRLGPSEYHRKSWKLI
ncbi:ribonuclease HII [Actinomycetaceae bacterium WB03_NA08]|uniref:Ribonuclease n=1 Tax=Scrofimicrobium canadense TaxID=2652290 RepID=A0A6N7VTT9_9ACTO|nr:ribonuclease HII [Scrofimicrobium canadense]MSS85189.1 ribonuclease HII [Scrofimicrobium canadense]